MIINPYVYAAVGYNPLTNAWIAETGETDQTIIDALNTLEQGLIDNSLSSKIKALYPMAGGTATKHKYNFMDARDLDAAFRLSFIGGWTHSADGALPNGTNGYARTYLNPVSVLTINDTHFSLYTNSPSIGSPNNQDIVCYAGSASMQLSANYNFGAGGPVSRMNTVGNQINVVDQPTDTGFYIGSRTSSDYHYLKKTTTILGTSTSAAGVFPNINIELGGSSFIGTQWSTQRNAFASIGTGLTDGESNTLNTLVTAYQTALSRNV